MTNAETLVIKIELIKQRERKKIISQILYLERYHVGQNLAIRGVSNGYEKSVANGVQDWYDEVEFYNPQDVQKLK